MQCHVSWDSYKRNICNGFSSLQQKEEFVDMTIAADGHLVKVHRNLVALASPYIKEMLKSASCQHPVIFLNNVSNEVLCYILEYIYTGEVGLPVDKINTFINAAKALRIIGLEGVVNLVPKRDEASAASTRSVKKSKPVNKSNNNKGENSILKQLMVQNGLSIESDLLDATADDGIQENLDFESIIKPVSIKVHETEITDIDPIDNIPYQQEENYNLASNMEAEPIDSNTEPIDWSSSMPDINFNQNIESQSGQILNYNIEIQRLTDETPNGTSDTNVQANLDQTTTNNCDQFISTLDGITLSGANKQGNFNQTPTINNYDLFFPVKNDVSTIGDTNIQANLEQPSTNNCNQNFSLQHNDVEMQPSEIQPPIDQSIEILSIDQFNYPRITINMDKLNANESNFVLETEGSSTLPDTQENPPLYTLSSKGSMQLILNRYMYYLHHTSYGGRTRRWRCIEYRRQACKAYIDTDGEKLVHRKFEHCHPFHDDKILKKGQTQMMFTSIQQAANDSDGKSKDDGQKRTARAKQR